MDTNENARIDADLHERGPAYELYNLGVDTQEDLKSCPAKDRKFSPARAVRNKPS
jgi:hypothetical protein